MSSYRTRTEGQQTNEWQKKSKICWSSWLYSEISEHDLIVTAVLWERGLGSRGERRRREVEDRLMPCPMSASDGKTDEAKRTTVPPSAPPLLPSAPSILRLKWWLGWATAGWRRIEIDGEGSDRAQRSLSDFLVLLVWAHLFLLSHLGGRHGGTDGTGDRQTERGKTGGGDHYSMASWFSWSALISSLASLPSLLLLLFLCLCLRWLSPSSLSCLLLLLLLMEGEGRECGKGRRWGEIREVEERDQRDSKG